MKLMGHSKYETTLRYAHVLEKSQHEAVEKLVEAALPTSGQDTTSKVMFSLG
jgi:hypothetical protein